MLVEGCLQRARAARPSIVRDVAAVGLDGEHQAGAHGLAVELDGARAADARARSRPWCRSGPLVADEVGRAACAARRRRSCGAPLMRDGRVTRGPPRRARGGVSSAIERAPVRVASTVCARRAAAACSARGARRRSACSARGRARARRRATATARVLAARARPRRAASAKSPAVRAYSREGGPRAARERRDVDRDEQLAGRERVDARRACAGRLDGAGVEGGERERAARRAGRRGRPSRRPSRASASPGGRRGGRPGRAAASGGRPARSARASPGGRSRRCAACRRVRRSTPRPGSG